MKIYIIQFNSFLICICFKTKIKQNKVVKKSWIQGPAFPFNRHDCSALASLVFIHQTLTFRTILLASDLIVNTQMWALISCTYTFWSTR